MTRIRILPDELINQIAAGEVVERPASVVKELLENALDAAATEIRVDVEEGGRRLIRVRDNGIGMNPDEASLAFERHATSKIREPSDLERIHTLGFRGEALPSIAAVSRVRLLTSDGKEPQGTELLLQGGSAGEVRAAARSRGTTIEVRDLFFNLPARKKFLKSKQTELSHITGILNETAIVHGEIHLTLTHNGRTLLKVAPVASMPDRAEQLFGHDLREHLIEVREESAALSLTGLVSVPGYTRPSGRGLNFFVNRRPVQDRTLRHAVYEAYETLLMKGRHPVVYLFLDVDPSMVDVNVHPAKREVRFSDLRAIHGFVRDALRLTLQSYGRVPPGEDPGCDGEKNPRAGRIREAVATYMQRGGDRKAGWPDGGWYSGSSVALPCPARKEPTPPPVQTLFEGCWNPLGQVADSFIIARDCDGLVLVDQHAAHERILYERFKREYGRSGIPVQRLLIPVHLELSRDDSILLREHADLFHDLGVEIEPFGPNTFVVKGLPLWVPDSNVEDLIREILEEFSSLGQTGKPEHYRERIIHVLACRGAVKANTPLQREEMETLIRDLEGTESPHTCEHGRPTMIRISLQEIRRRFKRT